MQRTGLVKKSVYNVLSAVRKVAMAMMNARGMQMTREQNLGKGTRDLVQGTGEKGMQGTDELRGNNINDPSIGTRSPPVASLEKLTSRSSSTSPSSRTEGTSLPSSPEQLPDDDPRRIVMYPYKFADGKTMLYPTRVGDIELASF